MDIGWIGLGNMGARMVANLVAAGLSVVGFDLAPTPIDGVELAADATTAAKGKDIVITMLPDGSAVGSVAQAILPVMQEGAIFLDCSTADVKTTLAVADLAQNHNISAVDAPVSGGVGGAEAGTLTFMVGGEAEVFAKLRPLFDIMGKKAVHCGGHGSGQAAKICNNMIAGITMLGTCEAFVLADRLGLDRAVLHSVVSTASGYSWVMNDYCPAPGVGVESPADNNYAPGFAAELMLKDLMLAQMASGSTGASTPLGAMAARLYQQFVEEEGGRGKDFSAVLPWLEQQAKKDQ